MQQLINLQEIKTAVNKYGEVVISKNKKNDEVVMSMEEYKKKSLDKEKERKILESEEDYTNGRTKKAEEVFKEWEEKNEI